MSGGVHSSDFQRRLTEAHVRLAVNEGQHAEILEDMKQMIEKVRETALVELQASKTETPKTQCAPLDPDVLTERSDATFFASQV